MRDRAVAALAVVALAVALWAALKPSPNTGAGVVQAAKQYLRDIAKQNSLKIDRIKVIAVRVSGDEAVVRDEVTYHQYFQLPGMKALRGPEETVTLAVHLHRSSWNAGYANS